MLMPATSQKLGKKLDLVPTSQSNRLQPQPGSQGGSGSLHRMEIFAQQAWSCGCLRAKAPDLTPREQVRAGSGTGGWAEPPTAQIAAVPEAQTQGP